MLHRVGTLICEDTFEDNLRHRKKNREEKKGKKIILKTVFLKKQKLKKKLKTEENIHRPK